MPFVNTQVSRLGIRLTIFSLFLILAATPFPYDFSPVDAIHVSNQIDYLLIHVLLFIPLGFGLTCLIQKKEWGRPIELLLILAVNTCLSFISEALQVWLPTRTVSGWDALANIVGGCLGFLVFRLWGHQILDHIRTVLERTKRSLSRKIVATSILSYAALMFLMSIPLQEATGLTNWDDAFPLLVGNERGGDRPWRGRIHQLQIANRAISAKEVAEAFSAGSPFSSVKGGVQCSYLFTGEGSYLDESGYLPPLVWKGDSLNSQEGEGISLDAAHWLEAAPTILLTQEIRRTSQFTLSAIVATADPNQTGPARIVSLSGDPYHMNFTLGQKGSDLVFRLRTPLTGENGTNPELAVPNVFATSERRHLVITYDGSVLQVFVDGVRHSHFLELSPGAAFFSYLFPLNAYAMSGYKTLYYGIIFIPLGFLLRYIVETQHVQLFMGMSLIGIGSVLPPLTLEAILARVRGGLVNVENLVLGIALTAGAMLLFRFVERV